MTTNLRVPGSLLDQVRVLAAEEGKSINTFIKEVVEERAAQKQLIGKKSMEESSSGGKLVGMRQIYKLALIKDKPMGPLSKEDQIIYGE